MARTTVYNKNLTEDWEIVNAKNRTLVRDFLNYCRSMDKSPQTIQVYNNILQIFFCWNLRNNYDAYFPNIRKRDYIVFFGYAKVEYNWSSARIATVRATLSSLCNYVERILDDEFPSFKNPIKALEPIRVSPVREKTVLDPIYVEKLIDELVESNEIQKACWLALMYSSGMRKSEVIQMKDSFFCPENIMWEVMYRTPKIRTKGAGVRGKQIPRYVFVHTFQKYLDLWREERKRLGITIDHLFVTKDRKTGEYIPAKVATFNTWASWLSTYTGKDIYAHCYRHLWTSSLKRKNYPDSVIQHLQQWSDPKMVSVYNDMSEEEELTSFFNNFNSNEN